MIYDVETTRLVNKAFVYRRQQLGIISVASIILNCALNAIQRLTKHYHQYHTSPWQQQIMLRREKCFGSP